MTHQPMNQPNPEIEDSLAEMWRAQEPASGFSERTLERVVSERRSVARVQLRRFPVVRVLLAAALLSVGAAAAWNGISGQQETLSVNDRGESTSGDAVGVEKTLDVRVAPAVSSSQAAPRNTPTEADEASADPLPEVPPPRKVRPRPRKTHQSQESGSPPRQPTHWPSCSCGPGAMVCGCTELPEDERH